MANSYYDKLMLQYYQVLNNAWKSELKDAAKKAIINLASLSDYEKVNTQFLDDTMYLINQSLGEEFAATVTKPTQIFMEKCVKLGVGDVQNELPTSISIGLWGMKDQRLAANMKQQQVFWVGNHFDADVAAKFSDSLHKAMEQGYTTKMLKETLMNQFADLAKKSSAYWQGLAEHTALRVREFGRLNGYEKAGAKGYKLINPMDERTSDICRALIKEDKVYPLDVALDVRDKLMAVEMQPGSLAKAREQIKAIAPWVSD